MYSVLIVDDETPGREILSYLIDWNNTNFKICDTATNGSEAYEKYKKLKPDLIITDIQMPEMNGVELIEKIRKEDKEQKFVILSCYENFHYAQMAVKMNVSDYLLKDLLTKESIYEVLLKLNRELDEKNNSKNNFSQKLSIDEKDDIISSIISDTITLGNKLKSKVDSQVSKEIFNLKSDSYSLITISIDNYEESFLESTTLSYEDLAFFSYKINQILNNFSGGKCFLISAKGEISLIAGIEKNISSLRNMENTDEIIQAIKKEFHQLFFESSLTFGISNFFNNIELIDEYYKQSIAALNLKIFLGNNRSIFYYLYTSNYTQITNEVFDKKMEQVENYISKFDIDSIKKILFKIYHEDLKGFLQLNYLKYVNSKLLDLLIISTHKYQVAYMDIFDENYIPFKKLNSFTTIEEIYNWFSHIYFLFINIIKKKYGNSYTKHIQGVVNIIEEEYMVQELSLNYLAKKMKLHKVYLSRLFKEETGKNITEYIQEIRVKKVKILLKESDMKLYEIAEKVGYISTKKLSLYFKKITGKSAIEYKNSIILE